MKVALDKLKFWKKDEDLDLGGDPFSSGTPPMSMDGLGQPDTLGTTQNDPFQASLDRINQGMGGQPYSESLGSASFDQPFQDQQEQYPGHAPIPGSEQVHEPEPVGRDKDTELILAKLDMIKSELDSLHQRVRKIEQATEKKQSRYW
ncbi:hypothetical protein GOV11_03015 [Candidatus Woesearchaeota archaeon]|nr:hypothetical protein [Candidatus Woesearchaeota archaeon]